MKKEFLLLPLFTFLLCSCPSNNLPSVTVSESVNDIIIVDLNKSNFEGYIKYTKHQGFTGAAGFSPYKAWLEFEGLLSFGIYDVVVTYVVGKTPYNFKLDVSGGGKTDYFDRNSNCQITEVSGTVTYRL